MWCVWFVCGLVLCVVGFFFFFLNLCLFSWWADKTRNVVCDVLVLQPGCSHPVNKSFTLWSSQGTGLQILAGTTHDLILLLGKVFWEQCPGNDVLYYQYRPFI